MRDKQFLIRVLICIALFGVLLYSYIDRQNSVTRRRLEIPVLAKEIKELKETNARLQYEIDLFESPEHLMQLARLSEYSHLKEPLLKEVLMMQEGLALEISSREKEEKITPKPKVTFAVGAK